MKYRFDHQVSEEWLKARKRVLTATDVKALLPAYKRILKKPVAADQIVPEFAALWAEKKSTGLIETSSPSSSAARGHVMEPWAVRAWNMSSSRKICHWDDCIVTNGLLGFSPDALDVSCPTEWAVEAENVNATFGVEIKSYEPAKHMKSILVSKAEKEERMQLASAFAVMPQLQKMFLLLFCPSAPIPVVSVSFTRDDLAEEIDLIEGIANEFLRNAKLLNELKQKMPKLEPHCTEQEVWEEYERERADMDSTFALKG